MITRVQNPTGAKIEDIAYSTILPLPPASSRATHPRHPHRPHHFFNVLMTT